MRRAVRAAILASLIVTLAACESQDGGSSNVQGGTNRAPGAPPQGTVRPTATAPR